MAKELQQWSPFRELERFRRDFDDLFDRFFGGSVSAPWSPANAPKIESYIEDDKMVVRADLPGIDPKDVEVSVTGETLTLRATRQAREENKGRDFRHREVSYGSFERTLTLPKGVKTEDIRAAYQNGVLELTIPVPKEAATRKVPIEVETGKQSSEKK
ncbi:MAG: Hsp20/alpha crystallin family protein [Candidatus Binataceae bacterium]